MTRFQQIATRAENGQGPQQISADLGAPISSVYSAISKARQQGYTIPHFSTGRQPDARNIGAQEVRFNLPLDVARVLADEAARRNLRPSRLARDLLTVICEDDMFAALLED